MRIASVTLERYGNYEDCRLDFGRGLTMVTGPNEAGKSALLDALSDLLWGFPRPARHTYLTTAARLSIAATLQIGDDEVRVRRTTRGLTDDTATVARPVWGEGGAEARQVWRQGFGLDHTALREGGRQLCSGSGDLSELIFTARSGQDVRSIINQITQEADRLYRPHRNSRGVEVRTSMASRSQFEQDIQLRMAGAAAVAALHRSIDEHERLAARLRDDRRRAALEVRKAAQRSSTVTFAAELADLRAEMLRLRDLGVAMDQQQLDRYTAATGDRDNAAERVQFHQAQIDDLRDRHSQLRVEHTLLVDASSIERLAQAAQARAADAERLGTLRREATDHQQRAEQILCEVTGEPARPVAEWLAELAVGAARLTELNTLAEEVIAARDAADRADQAQLDALRDVRHNTTVGLDLDAEAAQAVRELRKAIEAPDSAVNRWGDAVTARAEAIVALRRARAAAGCLITDDDGPLLDPPPADRVSALRTAMRDAVVEASAAERDTTNAQERARRSADTLAAFGCDTSVVTGDHLVTARSARDEQLGHLLAVLADGGEPFAVVAAAMALEGAIHETDRVADQLIAAGDGAAEHDRLRAAADAAEAELGAARRATQDAARKQRFATVQWTALWSAVGVRTPEPDAAVLVLDALGQAHHAESGRQHAQSLIDGLAGPAAAQESGLRAALAAAGRDRDSADVTALLIAAAELEADFSAARDAQLQLDHLRERASGVCAEADARRHDVEDATRRWRFTARTAGLASSIEPSSWAIHRDLIAKAAQAHLETVQINATADEIKSRLDQHHTAVAQLVGRHSSDQDASPDLGDLLRRVRASTEASISARHLNDEIARATGAQAEARTAIALATTELDDLANELSVVHEHDLLAAAERGRRSTHHERESNRLTSLIVSAAPDLSLEAWVGEAPDCTESELADQLTRAELAEAQLSDRYTDAHEKLGSLRREMSELENSEPVAAQHARAQEHLVRAAESAERYVVLHLQREILRTELEAYERQHSSPLLAEAGLLLERLTGGRYVALRPDVATGPAETARSLVAVRADDEELTTAQLSEGTADQVYLALRLAGINQLQQARVNEGFPPILIVLDDVLMTFDDDRATAALHVLVDLATRWQIVLLTHHSHLAILHDGQPISVIALPPVTPLEPKRDPGEIRAEAIHPPAPSGPPAPRSDSPDPGDVRAWARATGYEIGERGRIPADVLHAYLQHV